MATDAQAIITSVFPAHAAKIAGTNPRVFEEIQTGFIDQYSGSNPADCAQAGPINPTQYQDSGMGLLGDFTQGGTTGAKISSAIDTGLKAIPVVGQFLSQVWNKVNPFVHHAQAVAKEQGTLCQLIPEVNATLRQIDADVQAGNISAADGTAELEQMSAGFSAATQPIYKDCNAACVMRAVVEAEAKVHEQKYVNSPMYYVKKYWYVGVAAILFYLFWNRER